MASKVDICNLALAHLGDSATVSNLDPPEGSAQAELCATFYPIALSTLLEMHPWRFATRRESLASLDVDTWNWGYAYAKPSSALKILAVLPKSASSTDESQDYELVVSNSGSQVILTNQEDACVLFTMMVNDTTAFSPLFTDALARLLSSYIAGPLIKGDAGAAMAKSCMQGFYVSLSSARASDANQRRVSIEHTPDWISAR